MKNTIEKILFIFNIFLGTMLTLAQAVPPPPENPEGGGDIGGPATPIDGYLIILFVVALLVTFYYKTEVN